MRGVATNIYSRKMSKKPERCGLRTLSVKGSGVVFTHGEGISTPRVRHKGRQLLTKCVISCLRFVLFSLLRVFLCFYTFYIFYVFVVDKGVSLAPMYSSIVIKKSDLRSSLRTKCLVKLFLLNEMSFKALDH